MTRVGSRRGSLWAAGVLAALSLVTVLFAARAKAAPSSPTWESKTSGLVVRGVTSLRITARGPEVWYACIYGNKKDKMGLCESRDKGKSWKPIHQGMEQALSPLDECEITLDPKDEKVFYVVTRGRIYRTSNAGAQFDDVGAGTQTFSRDRSQQKPWIAGVAVDPTNSKRLLAGTLTKGYHGGLFESRDGGKSWNQIAGTGDRKELIDSHLGHDAWPISLDKTDKFALVGGLASSAWLSEDRGVQFKLVQPGGAGVHRAYAFTPMTSGEVYLAESRGLWRSRDRGASWGKEAVLAGTCLAVDLDPGNRKVVYAIVRGQGLYRTENLPKWEGPKHFDHDPHDVVVHPHAKNTILLTSKTTGLSISTDRGETFQSLSDKLPDAVPAITHAAAHPSDARQMLAVSDTGWVFASQDGGATWTRPGNIGSPVTRLVGDPAAPGTWVAAGAGVFVTTDLGAKWQPTFVSRDPEDRVIELLRQPDGAWLALWERDGRISVSRDGCKTWDPKPIERPTASKSAWTAGLAVDPRDPKHMLLATRTSAEEWSKDDKDGGPYETKDGGATWTLLDAGLKNEKSVWREGWNFGAGAAIDPSGALLYAVDGVGVFRMEPAGADGKPAAWAEVAMTGAPAQPDVSLFMAGPTAAGGAEYVMQLEGLTTRALVRSQDAGKTWTALTPDPGVALPSLAVDPSTPGRYITGDPTGDRGVLIFEVPGSTPPPSVPPVAPSPPPVAPTPPPPAPAEEKPVKGLDAYTAGADKSLRVYDLNGGKADSWVGAHDGAVLCVVMTKDESRLYTGCADKTVRIWDGTGGASLGRLEGHTGAVTALAVSADGNTLYAGDSDFRILVWDLKEKKATARLEGHTSAVTALALSADGTRLYSASQDHSVRVWDAAKGKEIASIPGHPAEVLALALSSDGKKLYTGGRDATVRVFDGAGAPAGTLATKQHAVTALALAPDGATLYVAGDEKFVEALSTADGASKASYASSGEGGTACVAVSLDGRWIVGGGGDGVLRLWREGRPEPAWASGKDHTGAIFGVALTVDVEPEKGSPGSEPAMAEPPAMAEQPPAMGDAPPAPAMSEPPAPPAMGEAPAPSAMGDAPPAPAMSDVPPAPAMSEPAMSEPAMADTAAMGK